MARPQTARRHPPPAPPRMPDPVARAEAAIARLSTHFAGWMQDECRRLDYLCQRVEADPADTRTLDQVQRAAHDIASEAATFGYPLIERIANNLDMLLIEAPRRSRIPFALIAQHAAAARKALRDPHAATADELTRATARFLREARRGNDYPNVKGPPLAPA